MPTVSFHPKKIAQYDIHSVFLSASNDYVVHYYRKHKNSSMKSTLIFCFTADDGRWAAEQCSDTEAAA